MSIQFVKSQQDFANYLSSNKYVVAQFTASWCGPCQAIKPVLDDIYADPAFNKIEIVRVDLDAQPEIASKYQITSVPTFVFFESGEVVDTFKGASLKVKDSFVKMNERASADSSVVSRGSSVQSAESSEVLKAIEQYIPSGYSVLNGQIHGGDFEALNTVSSEKSGAVKDVFDLTKSSFIYSDADSQSLLFVPLTHISKVYSVLIKTCSVKVGEDSTLDEDDIEETQKPNLIKIWGNKLNILSFDDASDDNSPPHMEKLAITEDGWYECRLKLVRFQNVQGLNIFLDGEDDDYHTVVEKLVIVGIGMEEKGHANMVEKMTAEE